MWPETLSTIGSIGGDLVGLTAAAAALMSAGAAHRSARAAGTSAAASKKALKLAEQHEKNRIAMLKERHQTEHMAELIVAFARVQTLAGTDDRDDRNGELRRAFRSVEVQAKILAVLDTTGGAKFQSWLNKPLANGVTIKGTVREAYGAERGLSATRLEPLDPRMNDLQRFQDELFASILHPDASQPADEDAAAAGKKAVNNGEQPAEAQSPTG